jgi:hypothetical protein
LLIAFTCSATADLLIRCLCFDIAQAAAASASLKGVTPKLPPSNSKRGAAAAAADPADDADEAEDDDEEEVSLQHAH